jgi:hydroxymethylpyrimidine kinase/phosphomethylpyrimidine kinase
MQVALTIAGSDSGGGAGIQADLKTFHAFGVFGTSAVTAVTVQDTTGVHGIHVVPADIVRAQIRAVARDLQPAACKTGMLATRELVVAVAESIREEGLPNAVIDPVMVAGSGDRLLEPDAEAAIRNHLLPLCTLVTPNIFEASILTGETVHNEPAMEKAAEQLVAMGARNALVKGGHLESELVANVLFDGRRSYIWRRPRLASRNTHGTGCTLSAAVAACLAGGADLIEAIDTSLDYVYRAIESAPALGRGNGPLNHFVVPIRPLPDARAGD